MCGRCGERDKTGHRRRATPALTNHADNTATLTRLVNLLLEYSNVPEPKNVPGGTDVLGKWKSVRGKIGIRAFYKHIYKHIYALLHKYPV